MLTLQMTDKQVHDEIERIAGFLDEHLAGGEKAVIGVSGGLDSDVVARLTARAIGVNRLKLFVVIQEGMDPRHLANARALASDLGTSLVEIDLAEFPFTFMQAMEKADPAGRFRPHGLLDPSRAKCSMRTVVFSTYQDRGYVVVGTLNRTQLEVGMTMAFGDGAAHLMPCIHLYKSEERHLAGPLGVGNPVIAQPASSGSWLGAQELEDIGYWLYHESPILEEVPFSKEDHAEVARIHEALTTERVDLGLLGLARGLDDAAITRESGLPAATVVRLRKLTVAAHRFKQRPLGVRMDARTQ